jgi:hypothetical protein
MWKNVMLLLLGITVVSALLPKIKPFKPLVKPEEVTKPTEEAVSEEAKPAENLALQPKAPVHHNNVCYVGSLSCIAIIYYLLSIIYYLLHYY